MGQRDVVQGTLEMLILKTLALEPMHGYGVATRIEQVSQGVFRVNPGSLLPALARMERAGQVNSEWRASENNRRAKYYTLTPRGRKASPKKRAHGSARSRQLPGSWKLERTHGRNSDEAAYQFSARFSLPVSERRDRKRNG